MMRATFAGTVCAAAFALAGCGGGFTPETGVVVTGKVVQGGQPIAIAGAIPGYGHVDVRMVSPTAGQSISSAHCDSNGFFEILGEGDGIPPGKYKLAILAQKDPSTDMLGGKLDEQNTTIEIDVPQDKMGGKHDLGVIDVATHLK